MAIGSDYRDGATAGRIRVWALRHDGKDVGLLTIDTDSRVIEECLGTDNEPLGWERDLFLEMQRALEVSGDQINEMVESGAFSLFVHQPNLRPVRLQIGERTYQVWSSGGALVLCDERKRWSQFKLALPRRREIPSCDATYGSALDADELVCLVAVCPELGEGDRSKPARKTKKEILAVRWSDGGDAAQRRGAEGRAVERPARLGSP